MGKVPAFIAVIDPATPDGLIARALGTTTTTTTTTSDTGGRAGAG
jgi:hypothetical protein